MKCRLHEVWVTLVEIFLKFQIKKVESTTQTFFKFSATSLLIYASSKRKMVTLKRTDLLLDLIDFLEFKKWQRMQDRRDGGE